MTDAPVLPVHKHTTWLPDGRRLTAEDWPSPELAAEAALVAGHMAAHRLAPVDWERLADDVAENIGVDLSRPYGCAIIVESV